MVDEGRFINNDKLKNETMPALGGFQGYFKHVPWHHSLLVMSDMPATQKPAWFEMYKEKADEDVISAIQAMVVAIWRLKNEYKISKSPSILNEIQSLRLDVARLQSVAIFYREFSSLENLLLLGEKYFQQMKRDLPPLIFQSSILCKRVRLIKDGFYSALDPELLV